VGLLIQLEINTSTSSQRQLKNKRSHFKN